MGNQSESDPEIPLLKIRVDRIYRIDRKSSAFPDEKQKGPVNSITVNTRSLM